MPIEHEDRMSDKVGVWIDHKRAVIVSPDEGAAKTVSSDLGTNARHSGGGGGYPGSNSSQTGGSERQEVHRHDQALVRYYDEVIAHLGHPASLLIFGPGEAKLELKARLLHAMQNPQPAVALEVADHLTDSQIVAQVRAHFR
jgi:hypothetical protein